MKIDESLKLSITQMAEGKEEGFSSFYSQTYNFVYRRARFIMKNDEDALDLTQETFLQAYKNISTLEDVEKVYAWLSTIAYNHGNKLHNKKKKQPVLLNEETEMVLDNIVSTDQDTSPEDASEAKATSEIVKGMIEELPELQKAAILAFYYDNMKIDDIAVMFDCSANTIKSRLNYAKKALQEKVLAHEKANNYKLCSVSPAVILMALEALFGTAEYSMSATTASTLCAATESALFAAGASASATTAGTAAGATGAAAAGSATAAGATATAAGTAASSTVAAVTTKVGLTLAAKVTIALAAVGTTAVVAVGAATGAFDSVVAPPTETEVSSEYDSSSESIIPSESETPSESEPEELPPLASVYDTQFANYADSGHYLLMVTDGHIASTADWSNKLTADSDIYIMGKDGEYHAIHNKNANGKQKYLAIAPCTFNKKVLAIVQVEGNYLNLLLPDGTLLDATTKFRSFVGYNDFVIAHTRSDSGTTYNIYDSNLNLLKAGISDFSAITNCYSFGEYTVIRGKDAAQDIFISCVYDKNWNRIDYIPGTGNEVNVYTVIHGTYLWTGSTLRDQNYNEVTLKVPDFIHPNGESVQVQRVSDYSTDSEYCYVYVLVTDSNNNTTETYYIIDDNNHFYKNEAELKDILWVECHGVNIMCNIDTFDRYVVWKDTGEVIYTMLDWDTRIKEIYGDAAVYGLAGDAYTDGSVIAMISVIANGEYLETGFLLRKEDGYSVDKAIHIGPAIVYYKGLYYAYDTNQVYLNHTLVDCHNMLFNDEEGYYVLENADGTFTVYRPDQTAHFTTSDNIIYSFSPSCFLAESTENGITSYKLLQP